MDYRIISILDEALGQHKEFAKGELYYSCPFCNHYNKKFAVNVNKLAWHCWKCGKSGRSLIGLLRKIGAARHLISEMATLVKEFVPEVMPSPVQVSLPTEYISLSDTIAIRVAKATFHAEYMRKYLTGRGITDADILLHRIGFCKTGKYANRIIFPSYDANGQLNFFVARAYINSTMPYLIPDDVSKDIIGFEQFINFDYPVVLVEGVFDAMAVKRNAIPLFGKTVPKKLQQRLIEEGVKEIYLALDTDALKEVLKISERFMKEGIDVYVVKLPGKDPSHIGFIEMRHLIKSATKLSFADLIKLKLSL